MTATGNVPIEEQVLVELAQWLARVMQYSSAHPACADLGERTHRTLTRALAARSPVQYGILADDIVVGEVPTRHPAIRGRLAPHLHERGLLVLRFAFGVSVEELTQLVELLTLPAQSLYDKGGMLRLLLERGVARVQVDEIAHDVTNEEREAQRRRKRLRDFFKDMLRNLVARRSVDEALREHLGELLEHPDIACAILEEDPVGIAEAAAGFALMAQQEGARQGGDLAPKLRAVLAALSPKSRDRLVLGVPALVGEFRAALLWAFEGFTEQELARFAFPVLRANAAELDVVGYAVAAIVPRESRRLSVMRWLSLMLLDLVSDDAAATDVLALVARPVAEYESLREEREHLQAQAARALASRAFFTLAPVVESVPPMAPGHSDAPPRASGSIPVAAPPGAGGSKPPAKLTPAGGTRRPSSRPPGALDAKPLNGRATIAEVVRIAAQTGGLARLCRTLPTVAATLAERGDADAIVGVVRGLSDAARADTAGIAAQALEQVGASGAAARVLDALDIESALEGEELEDMNAAVKLVVAHDPQAAIAKLETSQSRKMRRLLLDAIPHGGERVLPLVRAKLRASEWFVVRNAVLLVARCGGTPRDLAAAARHPNEKVRLELARALRNMQLDDTAMDIVAVYLTDASHEVSQAARILLRGELLGPAAIATITAVAADEAQPEDLRRRVLDALANSPSELAATALHDLLQPHGLIDMGSAAAIRDATAAALRASRAPIAARLFAAALVSSNRRVRKSCERAAGKA